LLGISIRSDCVRNTQPPINSLNQRKIVPKPPV